MNKLSAGLIVLAAVVMGCNKKVDLKDENQMISYAVGQQIGQNIKNTGVDLNTQVLAQAIKDATQGKNEMKPEEIQQAMTKLQENMQKKQSEIADKNIKEGKEFLEKNKSQSNVKTTASGLQYVVEKEGEGKTPTKEDMVKVHYKGTLTNGTQFDSSYDRGEPAEFPVGGVIPGWTEALTLMKEGAKYKLVIPSDLAYGPSGRPGIPPNSVLLFDVELLEVKKAPAASATPAAKAPAKKHK
jgi:FKBP-type peptidyl-prolyl cis-trans isomerase